MTHYKTAGEQFSLVMPLLFFLTNRFFEVIGRDYFDFSIWWISLFLIYPVAHFFQFKVNVKIINYFYAFNLLISIFLAIFISFRFLFLFLGLLFNLSVGLNIELLISIIVLLMGYFYSKIISTKRIEIKSSKLLGKYKLIQISDAHVFGKTSTFFLNSLVEKILKQSPDIVVITGDLFDYYGLPAEDSLTPFKKINCPIYYVYGNHETKLLKTFTHDLLKKSTLIPLENQIINFNELQIIGMSDGNTIYLKEQAKKISVDKKSFSIFLQHKPRNVNAIAKKGVDLMLSGHTHAGQFFPIDVLLHLRWKYLVGLYEVGKMKLYVSRGTGTKSFPFKLFVGNEITVIDLLPLNNKLQ